MPTSLQPAESLRLSPTSGCGTLESPWTGWEDRLEDPTAGSPRTFALAPGFYAVSRPVRLTEGVTLTADPARGGQVWFLPAEKARTLETVFLVERSDQVRISGICVNGGRDRARSGLLVKGSRNLQVSGCRFEDFGHPMGSAIRVEGESSELPAHEIVVQSCLFLSGTRGLVLGRDTSDLLVVDNRFDEIAGASLTVDPGDQWMDYGLIFVKNRIHASRAARIAPFVTLRPGAEGIRLAENTVQAEDEAGGDHAAVDIEGGGPLSRRRLEVLLNRILGGTGPGIRASQCGPGFVAAGNEIFACGSENDGSLELVGCHGVLAEDNDVKEPAGPGIRVRNCSASRLNGNEVKGSDSGHPRGGSVGLIVEGDGSRRLRLTDNRVSSVKEAGIHVDWCEGARIVGNEVEDCGEGIHVAAARRLLLVGNDCRDNGRGGIRIAEDVRRGLVALNYAILNGTIDLDIRGERIRYRSNKVDRQTLPPATASE